jgi:hypothetical protein
MQESRFLHELRQYLIAHWKEYHLDGSPAQISYRIRQIPRGRALDQSRIVALWFSENPEEPKLVTKWVLQKEYAPFILQEHTHSKWLYETNKEPFVPRPLDCLEISGVLVLIEEAIQGRSMAHRLIGISPNEAMFQEVFSRAEEILEKIQGEKRAVSKADVLKEIYLYLEQAERALNFGDEKKKEIWEILNDFPLEPVPASGEVLLIGDFGPQNIILGKTNTYLIDLEFSHTSLLAFMDPLSFVYRLFCFTIHPSLEKDAKQVVELLKKEFLNSENLFGKLSAQFLARQGIPLESQLWYWLFFFIHETAFQYALGETFSDPLKLLCDSILSILLMRLKKSKNLR